MDQDWLYRLTFEIVVTPRPSTPLFGDQVQHLTKQTPVTDHFRSILATTPHLLSMPVTKSVNDAAWVVPFNVLDTVCLSIRT